MTPSVAEAATDLYLSDPVPETAPTRDDLTGAMRRQQERAAALSAIPRIESVKFVKPNMPRRLRGDLGLRLPPVLDREALRALAVWMRPLYGLEGSESFDVELMTERFEKVRVARLSQRIDGVPVHGAWLTIRWSKETGELQSVDGAVLPDRGLVKTPQHQVAEILAAHAPDRVGTAQHMYREALPVHLLLRDGRHHLAWIVELEERSDEGGRPIRLMVDAVDGSLISKRSTTMHALDRSVFSAGNTTNDLATLVCDEASSCGDSAAAELKALLGEVYAFWSDRFGLDSYDGAGAEIIGSIRNSDMGNNAGYILGDGSSGNPDRFIFGTGDGSDWESISTGSSADFVSHEFAHGVSHDRIGRGFTGTDESEAINEGLSDVFAAVFDWHQNGLSTATWGIFDDIYRPGPNYEFKPYRFMANPIADGRGSIDHYSDSPKPSDSHLYAGILNLAFYKLATGGAHPQGQSPGVAVPPGGLGIEVAAEIFFEAMPELGFEPNFEQLRDKTALAAAGLFPNSTYERDAVHLAWDVVGVPGSPVQSAVPDAPPSPIDVVPSCTHSGWNDVSWNSPESGPPTDFYELEWSLNNSFSNPVNIYTGPELAVLVVIESTSWVRLRACNTVGCSAWRGPKKLTYYEECP